MEIKVRGMIGHSPIDDCDLRWGNLASIVMDATSRSRLTFTHGKWTGHRMDVAKRSVIASQGYNRFSVAVVFLSISRDDFERLKEKESQISSAGVSGFYAITFQVTN